MSIGQLYHLKINTPNRFFIIKGKEVRTPIDTIVSENDMRIAKVQIQSEGIKDYILEKHDPNAIKKPLKEKTNPKVKKEKKEKKIKEPKSTLEKLMV